MPDENITFPDREKNVRVYDREKIIATRVVWLDQVSYATAVFDAAYFSEEFEIGQELPYTIAIMKQARLVVR